MKHAQIESSEVLGREASECEDTDNIVVRQVEVSDAVTLVERRHGGLNVYWQSNIRKRRSVQDDIHSASLRILRAHRRLFATDAAEFVT